MTISFQIVSAPHDAAGNKSKLRGKAVERVWRAITNLVSKIDIRDIGAARGSSRLTILMNARRELRAPSVLQLSHDG